MTTIPDPRQRRYGMGRLLHKDARDAAFPMAAVLAEDPNEWPKRTRPWRLGPVLDQGETQMCTGYSARSWLMAEPIRTMAGPDPATIYGEAQKRDPWKDVAHEGSTVRAAMQYLQDAGHVASYVWATEAQTVIDWLLHRGTVIMGTLWYRSMFRPDPEEHIIRVEGAITGGHAWHLVWWDEARGLGRIQNSWGADWTGSDRGFAWISGEDLDRLIKQDGEACAPVERRVYRRPVPDQPDTGGAS